MADEGKSSEGMSSGQKGGWLAGIASAVLIAVLAGGNRPWWMGGETKSEAKPAPTVVNGNAPGGLPSGTTTAVVTPAPASPKPEPTAEAKPVASAEFMLGRWRAEQNNAMAATSATTTYYKNGRFEGHGTQVVGYLAQPMNLTGAWQVETVSDKVFRLNLRLDNGNYTSINFKVLDKDHLLNLDMNYVAERVE